MGFCMFPRLRVLIVTLCIVSLPGFASSQQQQKKSDQKKPDQSQAQADSTGQQKPDSSMTPLSGDELKQLSKEDAMRILQALEDRERQLQQERRKAQFRKLKRSGKDW